MMPDPKWREKVRTEVTDKGREILIYPSGEAAYVGEGTPSWWSTLDREAQLVDLEEITSRTRWDFPQPFVGLVDKLWGESGSHGRVLDNILGMIKKGEIDDWLMFETEPKAFGR